MRTPLPLRALAVLGPLVVAAAWFAWVTAPPEGGLARKPAGMERALARAEDPRVVLLGNSLADASVDPAALAEALGLEPDEVVALTSAGFTSAGFYAIAKNRLFAHGHAPDAIVLPTHPYYLYGVEPDSPVSRRRMLEHFGPVEPELRAALAGGTPLPPALEAVGTGRGRRSEALLDGVKALGAAAWGLGDGLADAEQAADDALGRVFGDADAVDLDLLTRAVPVVEVVREGATDPSLDLDRSLFDELVDLCEAHGTRLFVVHVPITAQSDHHLPADAVRDLIARANARGVGWLDLSTLSLSPGDFADEIHVNEAGRARVMEALVEALPAYDLLGDAPFPEALPPVVLDGVRREGTPVAPSLDLSAATPLEAFPGCLAVDVGAWAGLDDATLERLKLGPATPLVLRQGRRALQPVLAFGDLAEGTSLHGLKQVAFCPHGGVGRADEVTVGWTEALPVVRPDGRRAVWWIAPGTAVHLDVPALEGEAAVEVQLLDLGPEGGARPRRGEQAVDLALDGARVPWSARGRKRTGRADVPSGAPWTLSVAVPDGGTPHVLHAVVLHRGEADQALVGTVADLAPPPLRLVSGRQEPREETWTAPEAPVAPSGPPVPLGDGVTRLPRPDWGWMSDEALAGRWRKFSCSPVRLVAGGEEVAGRNVATDLLRRGESGWWHRPEGVDVRLPDGAGLRLEDLRLDRVNTLNGCVTKRWVHPGQTMTVVHRGAEALTEGASHLLLVAETAPGRRPRAPGAHLIVRGGGGVALEVDLPAGAFDGAPHAIPLDVALGADLPLVRAEVAVPDGGASVLFSTLSLVADPPASASPPPASGAPAADDGPPGALAEVPIHDGDLREVGLVVQPGRDARIRVTREGGRLRYANTEIVDARLCLPRVRGDAVRVQAALRLVERTGHARPVQTAAVVVRYRAADDTVLRRAGRPWLDDVRLFDEGAWTALDRTFPLPEAADHAVVCLEFIGAAGAVDVARLEAAAP